MTPRDILATGFGNLRRRKVRTVLTSIGVFVGILTIVTMISAGIGMQTQVTDTIMQWGLQTVFVTPDTTGQSETNTNFSALQRPAHPIRPTDLARLSALPGVLSVEPHVNLPDGLNITMPLDGKTQAVRFVGTISPAALFSPKAEMIAGHDLPQGTDARGLVLSQAWLRSRNIPASEYPSLVGSKVTLHVEAPRGEQTDFPTTIVGVSAALGGVQIGTADALDIKKWWFNAPDILETEGYLPVVLRTASLKDAGEVSKAVTAMGFQSATLQVVLDQVNLIFTIIETALSGIGLLALLVASIGIANTMIMAIFERTREIGVLKALGASGGDIMRLFIVEASAIGLIGGVFGVIGGWLLSRLLDWIAHLYLQGQQVSITAPFFVLTPELVAGALVFATIIGLLAGLYPASRASRLDPLAALRHE
ncbi:MAG: ABC transporter permease [Chloroflexia bacterium]